MNYLKIQKVFYKVLKLDYKNIMIINNPNLILIFYKKIIHLFKTVMVNKLILI